MATFIHDDVIYANIQCRHFWCAGVRCVALVQYVYKRKEVGTVTRTEDVRIKYSIRTK